MPVYEFECSAHGTFDEQRPMSLARAAAACPTCGGAARRVLSIPHVAQLAPSERRARDVNERSCHEPRLSQREPPRAQDPPPPRLHATQGRPWAIGH
jgi:putative FmdB family regulatory protein